MTVAISLIVRLVAQSLLDPSPNDIAKNLTCLGDLYSQDAEAIVKQLKYTTTAPGRCRERIPQLQAFRRGYAHSLILNVIHRILLNEQFSFFSVAHTDAGRTPIEITTKVESQRTTWCVTRTAMLCWRCSPCPSAGHGLLCGWVDSSLCSAKWQTSSCDHTVQLQHLRGTGLGGARCM